MLEDIYIFTLKHFVYLLKAILKGKELMYVDSLIGFLFSRLFGEAVRCIKREFFWHAEEAELQNIEAALHATRMFEDDSTKHCPSKIYQLALTNPSISPVALLVECLTWDRRVTRWSCPRRHCIMSFSKILYTMLSTDSTWEKSHDMTEREHKA